MEFTQIKETVLYVRDLERTRAFYNEKLELPVVSFIEESHVFFRAGTSMLLCFLPEKTKVKEDPPPHYAEGNIHLAFEAKPEDYRAWKERVKERNIPIEQVHHWKKGTRESFYFRDPDGHLLEILEGNIWA